VIKLLCEVVYDQRRLVALDWSLQLCVVRFRGLGMQSKLVSLMSQSVMMSSFEGMVNP
jgi:hypothetical protein